MSIGQAIVQGVRGPEAMRIEGGDGIGHDLVDCGPYHARLPGDGAQRYVPRCVDHGIS
jgi:hypothetical protein